MFFGAFINPSRADAPIFFIAFQYPAGVSIVPENVKKPQVFWRFQGLQKWLQDIGKQWKKWKHWHELDE